MPVAVVVAVSQLQAQVDNPFSVNPLALVSSPLGEGVSLKSQRKNRARRICRPELAPEKPGPHPPGKGTSWRHIGMCP